MTSYEGINFEKSFRVQGRSFENAGHISSKIKALLQRMNISNDVVRRASVVTYEAEINICSYAERGRILLRLKPKFLTIEAIDEGQGIADIELAMSEGYFHSNRQNPADGFWAGMVHSRVKRFSTLFDFF